MATIILSNMGMDAPALSQYLAALAELRPEIENPVLHLIYSPHNKDDINTAKRQEIARTLVKKLDLPEGWPVFVYWHGLRGKRKRQEPHFHIGLPLINDAGVRLPKPPSPFRVAQIAAEVEVECGLKVTRTFVSQGTKKN